MVATVPIAETRTVLQNISWQTFKAMLEDMGCSRNSRLAYDSGALEIMTPLLLHENSNRLIEAFVTVLCEELNLEIKRTGSLTLIWDDVKQGAEPDSSYYIQNEPLMRSREKIDLATDPPPDLVLEVEYSKPKVDKNKIYSAIGVPEFWRFNGSVLRICVLSNGQYSEVEFSPTFGSIPVKEIPRFIQETRKNGENATTRAFRAWVRQYIE